MYGTQTSAVARTADTGFENDVKMYGTQTATEHGDSGLSLRMM